MTRHLTLLVLAATITAGCTTKKAEPTLGPQVGVISDAAQQGIQTDTMVVTDTMTVGMMSDAELTEAIRQIEDELRKANPNARPVIGSSGGIGPDSAWETVRYSRTLATRYTFARTDGRWRIVDSSRVK